MNTSELYAVVLAAGHGTRMKSTLPKVLHAVCGRPLLYYPVRAALDSGAKQVVIVVNPETHKSVETALRKELPSADLRFCIQEVPRGTGDAARSFLQAGHYQDDDEVLILSGDAPLMTAQDLGPLLLGLRAPETRLCFMTFLAADPTGYGRVLRDVQGQPAEIREHKDLKTDEERAVTEVNAGVYAAQFGALRHALSRLSPNNAQGEYYLTDIVPLIRALGDVATVIASEESLAGVNDRSQLREVEQILYERKRAQLGRSGVSISGAPLIDDSVQIEPDVSIFDGVHLRGNTRICAGTRVDVGTVITDCQIGTNVNIKPYCVLTESVVGDDVQLGPFAHLRPESEIEAGAHIGNFVETKKSLVKKGAKANHLAYIGDAEIGERTNLGAGTIICNYNGYQKQRTIVGDDVFVGSDSQLVAPVEIGRGAYVATASTVTRNVPEDALAIGRVRQENKLGYAKLLREKLKAAKAAEQDAAKAPKE